MVHRHGGKRLVIALFESPAAGEIAVRTFAEEVSTGWTPGSVGMLAHDEHGNVRLATPDAPTTNGGAGVAAILGIIGLAVSGGLKPGGLDFLDAESDMSNDDIARLGAELDAGQAAVAVLDFVQRADRALVHLAGLGAKTEVHRISNRALRQAASVAATDLPWREWPN